MKCSLAIVHNTIAPYRHPLFEKLSRYLDLRVYYCSLGHSSRKWELWPRHYDYKYKILSGMLLKTSVGDLSINPSILKELFLNRPQVLVLGGYVDATMWLAFAVGKLLKIPVIYWTEGTREPQSILGAITRPLRLLFLRKSMAVIVPGRLSKNYVASLGIGMERIFVAPNAIDNDLFISASDEYQSCKGEWKARLGFEGKTVILYVGQFVRRKGVKYLLYAYAKIERERDDVALVLVGSGPLEIRLKKLAYSLKLKDVRFIQSGLSLYDLIGLYSTANIFVLPTLEDIWGFVINEAMACRLPVIATRASQAAQEMVRPEKNGYVVKEANANELYEALRRLVYDVELREEMAGKSKDIVTSKFDVENIVSGFVRAIRYSRGRQSKIVT